MLKIDGFDSGTRMVTTTVYFKCAREVTLLLALLMKMPRYICCVFSGMVVTFTIYRLNFW